MFDLRWLSYPRILDWEDFIYLTALCCSFLHFPVYFGRDTFIRWWTFYTYFLFSFVIIVFIFRLLLFISGTSSISKMHSLRRSFSVSVTKHTFFFFFLLFIVLLFGDGVVRDCVSSSLSISLFLLQDWNLTLLACFFLYNPVFRGHFSLPLYPFSPQSDAFQDCHLHSCSLQSFLHCHDHNLPRLNRVLYHRLTFFPARVSNLSLIPFSLPSFLFYAVFPGLMPKVWHTALLGFGINFFF